MQNVNNFDKNRSVGILSVAYYKSDIKIQKFRMSNGKFRILNSDLKSVTLKTPEDQVAPESTNYLHFDPPYSTTYLNL